MSNYRQTHRRHYGVSFNGTTTLVIADDTETAVAMVGGGHVLLSSPIKECVDLGVETVVTRHDVDDVVDMVTLEPEDGEEEVLVIDVSGLDTDEEDVTEGEANDVWYDTRGGDGNESIPSDDVAGVVGQSVGVLGVMVGNGRQTMITDFFNVDEEESPKKKVRLEKGDRMSYVRGVDYIGWDTKGEDCPICLEGAKDGDFVTVLSCPGRHFMHPGCHSKFHAYDLNHQENTYPVDSVEAARRAEGSQVCPLCKGLSYCWINATAYTDDGT